MSTNITSEEYVVWVKGSLNRWLGAGLSENGDTAPPYREWVKEFQTLSAVCTRNGDVEEATQDAMIKANHQHDSYVNWVQLSLNQALQGTALAADGNMTSEITAAIQKFQVANGLKANGWVGAKTETALRKRGAPKPPAIPTKIPLLIYWPKWGHRTARELAKFWSNQWLSEPLSAPIGTKDFTMSDWVIARRLMRALWEPGADTEYIPDRDVENFTYSGIVEGPFGGIEPEQLLPDFKKNRIHDALLNLIKATAGIMDVNPWSYADGYNAFKRKYWELHHDIRDSMINILWQCTNIPPVHNLAVDIMNDWVKVKQQQEGLKSILRCFPDAYRKYWLSGD